MRSSLLLITLASAFVLVARPAHADVREVTTRVADQWKLAGAKTTASLPTKFLFDDDKQIVSIPQEEGTPSACTHIAIVGARGLSFRAKLSDAPTDPLLPPDVGARASSTAGVLELRRCDPRRPIRQIVVSSDAGRGAIEIVVARSPSPLPQLGSIIPERTGGALPPVPEAGALPPLAPQEKRAEIAEQRAKRDAATIEPRTTLRAGEDGTGEDEIVAEPGCHRFEVFGRDALRERAGRRFRIDLDAEIRENDHVLARDRTEAPDARLEACVGKTTALTLAFAGAPPNSEVLVTRASWPLPARLPPMWGPTTRSKMARVMFLRHLAVPSEDAVFLAQGSSGTTPLPLSVEPGGCYVAVVGVARGHARQLQLRTTVGARESTDERGAAEEAALTAFCVRAHENARVDVLARGTGVSWALAVFRIKSGIWEVGR